MKRMVRGFTVVEVMVAMGVLGLLGLLTVVLFRTGASGWKKMEAQSGLLADYQVLNEKISREVNRSDFDSASTAIHPDGTALAFLSAMDDTGTFVVNPVNFQPQWQKYLVFYWDRPSRKVFMTEVELAAGSPEIDNPERIEDYDAGTGNLNDYRTGGRLLMTNVDNCVFEVADTMLTLEIAASRIRYGDEAPETLSMVNSVTFRN